MPHRRPTDLLEPAPTTSWILRDIRIAPGRVLRAPPVFDTYWRFAARRASGCSCRVLGSTPWTDDPVLRTYRFTNADRAADRVSQNLIHHVLY